MRNSLLFLSAFCLFTAHTVNKASAESELVIGHGQMPNLAKDRQGNLHLVYGSGDSILYAVSSDQGKTFSSPSLVAVLPKVFSFATRGPQIAATKSGVLVTAPTSSGHMFAFCKANGGKWASAGKVNDAEATAKEGLIALGADGDLAYAVWLDLRGNKRNKIYGSGSVDGGKTWSKNRMIYTSPDTTVCECCKPSVAVKGGHVHVMFRNWLQGNRDLYLAQSADGGKTFDQAKKLGTGSWKLNGCPMDGGGLAVSKDGTVQTVWKREKKIYAAMPGIPEKEIGEGRACTVETVDDKNVYAWVENGTVVLVNTQGKKTVLGKGMQPVVKALDKERVLCVWENEKQIHGSVVEL